MNMASFRVLFIFTAVYISIGNGGFIHLQCMAENVGYYGQQTLLECVIKLSQYTEDAEILIVVWRKQEINSPVLFFNKGTTEPQPGYEFAESFWSVRSMNVSLLITTTTAEHEGLYTCTVLTDAGDDSSSTSLKVTGARKISSVSVSPSVETVEGSSVTLSCSSDVNTAATYTWYKETGNAESRVSEEPQLVFSSIQSSDSGWYYCAAENELGRRTSASISVDVKYAPKRPSVSVSPSEIEEGSSVTLTCSSDANPAANYTWYKEDEDSPKASGQIFTITDFRAKHSGNYYCEAENNRGRQSSTLHLITVAGNSLMMINVIMLILVVLLPSPLLLLSLCKRKKKTLSSTAAPHDPAETEFGSSHEYENDSDSAAQREDSEEQEDLV